MERDDDGAWGIQRGRGEIAMRQRGGDGGRWRVTRRRWLATAAALCARGTVLRAGESTLNAEETRVRDEILARAREVGISRLKSRTTRNFLVLGNAPNSFMDQAGGICENLLADYLEFFQSRKFPVHPPESRMAVVILATPSQQLKFLGDDDDPSDAAPVFDPDANRLVFFDLRAGGMKFGDARPGAMKGKGLRERANTVTICHEAALLVMENTGMLDPEGDAPGAIREGLADFMENRPAAGRSPLGGVVNTGKLTTLVRTQPSPWIPVDRLLTDESLFEQSATIRRAEAQSWMMVNYLLRSPSRLPGFLAYLGAVNARRDSNHRLEDARAHLGDLAQLDQDLQATAAKWRTYYDGLPPAQKPQGL